MLLKKFDYYLKNFWICHSFGYTTPCFRVFKKRMHIRPCYYFCISATKIKFFYSPPCGWHYGSKKHIPFSIYKKFRRGNKIFFQVILKKCYLLIFSPELPDFLHQLQKIACFFDIHNIVQKLWYILCFEEQPV